jgi:hypothetical protein
MLRHLAGVLLVFPGCQPLALDPALAYPHVVYDPTSGDIPLPNDLVRDAEAGRLSLPDDDEASAADQEFRRYLSSLDAWGTTFPANASFSEPIDPATVTAETVQVWEQGASPRAVQGVRLEVTEDSQKVVAYPPREGWSPGGRYAVVVRGGPSGVKTADGRPLGPDAAMYYLLAAASLDDPAHQHAFPGATRADRVASGAQLESARAALQAWYAPIGVPRDEIAALWSFTVTTRVELAMDKESQRVPLPFNLLLDRATGKVVLDPADWDTPLEAEAKVVANTFDGFGLSSNPFFEFTRGVDPSTINADTVQLWKIEATPTQVPIDLLVMSEDGATRCKAPPYAADCNHVFTVLPPRQIPLDAATTYAIVVTDGVRDLDGNPVAAMPIGHFMKAEAPLAIDGHSQLASLDDASAARLEASRVEAAVLLAVTGRENVLGVWPFTTMNPVPAIDTSSHRTEALGLDIVPDVEWRRPASSLLEDDALQELFPGALNPAPPIYAGRADGVREVISGTMRAPDFLDDVTRRWKPEYDMEKLPFWAMTPQGYSPDRRLPVLIFGHAIVTDRRFQLMIASELVARGFVVIGVDFPYHGRRVSCVESSLVAVPNFLPGALQSVTGFTDPLIWFPPCESGDAASCAPTGECLDARGRTEPFSAFPIIDIKPASGAAFMDTADIPHIPDHFHQALTDLSSLVHSLRTQDWESALGQRIDTSQFYFAGQSLGSIIGTVWVAPRNDIARSVFNVPGSNLVDLFTNSTYFKPQMDQLFVNLDVAEGSYEKERLLQVASWIVDSVDPHSVAGLYAANTYPGLIQMDKVDNNSGDLIIPNFTTENFSRLSGMETTNYPSQLHADLIVPLLGDDMLSEMATWLGGVPR